jgi:tetratricopeptide (TPR) repeat protein/predicted aspartyl protease
MLGLLNRRCCSACALAAIACSPVHAASKCQLAKLAELPITMLGLRPTIIAKINDQDAKFALDSGAFYSIISSATADQFNLRRQAAPFGLRVKGIGGSAAAEETTIKLFTIAGIPVHNITFLVGGSEIGGGVIGLLGQNLLEKWDIEYDFAKGVVRLFKASDCSHVSLAYWATAQQPLSIMDISYTTPMTPHTTGTAFINGVRIKVMFDTGAWTSMLTLRAAARAGIKPDTPGVAEAGYMTGIGRGNVKTYIAPFSSFKIGDNEEIKNTRLRIADEDVDEDMLIGADFFLSHHLLVSNSQHRLYFTYNGGPVFNLTRPASTDPTADPTADAAASQLPDAAAYSRRGAAFAGRRDFEHALADLQRASEMNPNEPEYFYRLGMIHWENKQAESAMADFDHALLLEPDHLAALVSRAQLRLDEKDISGATADLDLADRTAPQQADVRFTLAHLYQAADLLGPALAQFDRWIDSHPDDSKMAEALNRRCRIRALKGVDLPKALADCNTALRRVGKSTPAAASVLDSRGLVRLRLGDYDKAIDDYDDSLRLSPNIGWALYGRGIAKLRKKKIAEGEGDIAQAVKAWPPVAEEFKRRGIAP